MNKPRVILDVAFLGHPNGIQRGAERVVRHLFEGLQDSTACELSCVATSHLAGVFDFLESRGINPKEKLRFTAAGLARSQLSQTLTAASRSIHNQSLPARGVRSALTKLIHFSLRGGATLAPEWLDAAQIYHSPHSPFPAAVQEDARLKKFLTCHDFIPLRNPEYYPVAISHFMDGILACLQPGNFAFCVSEATRNDLLTYSRMPPERVFVTPLAADPMVFHPVIEPGALSDVRTRYRLGEEPYFLALSAHDPHKNFAHLIECFGRLVESGELRDFHLVIAGPNPTRNPAVQAAAARYPKAEKQIRVTGFVPDEDLAAIYSGASAFLFPSLAEGFGIPPLEAMHCGVPVIASNTTSIPEVVGEAGLLLPPTDRDAWCAAMLRVAQDAGLRAQLSERSLARARLFSWRRFIDETLRGYRASLEQF